MYLRMRHKIKVKQNHTVTIGEIAQIIAREDNMKLVNEKIIYNINMSDKNFVVIDVMTVINQIRILLPGIDIQAMGSNQTIVEIEYKKRNFSPIYFVGVWLLLFIGAALAVMNFHEDVSMREVHQRIYFIIKEIKQKNLFCYKFHIQLALDLVWCCFLIIYFESV